MKQVKVHKLSPLGRFMTTQGQKQVKEIISKLFNFQPVIHRGKKRNMI